MKYFFKNFLLNSTKTKQYKPKELLNGVPKKNEINNINLLGYTTYIIKKKKTKVSFKTFTLKCNL